MQLFSLNHYLAHRKAFVNDAKKIRARVWQTPKHSTSLSWRFYRLQFDASLLILRRYSGRKARADGRQVPLRNWGAYPSQLHFLVFLPRSQYHLVHEWTAGKNPGVTLYVWYWVVDDSGMHNKWYCVTDTVLVDHLQFTVLQWASEYYWRRHW